MAVARLSQPAQLSEVLARVTALGRNPPVVGGSEITWDAGRKNHFLSLYTGGPEQAQFAILHCSFPEGKLAEDKSFPKATGSPGGRRPLVDADAEAFVGRARIIEQLGIEKRRLILERIFDEPAILSNRSHVRFVDPSCVAIGCYVESDPILDSPLTVGPHQDAYLVATRQRTILPGSRDLFVQPHGTGNATSTSGEIGFDIPDGLYSTSEPAIITDSPTEIFDTHVTLTQAAPWLRPWIDATDVVELRLVGEILLRNGFPGGGST